MAKNESTSNVQIADAEAQREYQTFKEPRLSRREADESLLPGRAVVSYADAVNDVASGSASILRLIEWDEMMSELDASEDRPQLLSVSQKNAMLRMIATSMDLLVEQSERLTTWAFEHHTEEGKAERLAAAKMLVRQHEKRTGHGSMA